MDRSEVCIKYTLSVNVFNTTEQLKMLKIVNIMLSIFYHNENNCEKKVVKEKKMSTHISLSSKNIF